ncbi:MULTISPECIES: DNA topoisomerase [Shewanella]|jgi:DNA topoisomerase-3|uniref:DNA topoisomerase n=1 Tax=Shewanella xiamenensis TaxID=332186 RepID=A0AAE4TNB7_9GAMM|nr:MULTISPECIES: DNA topoisomerase [Shewanella]MDH0451069.1 DNA topoisomerase [Shewanella sp. GD04112]MDV5393097.1 DNA topoisomerase [Shewanella xiamenensis]
MHLIIAEKPAVAKAIAGYLNKNARSCNGYIDCGADGKGQKQIVSWCIGHLLTFKTPEEHNPLYKTWAVETLPMQLLPLTLKPIAKTKAQLKTLLDLLKSANLVTHAGDDDDEGQILVDEVLDYAKYKGQVNRLKINDLNEASIAKAFSNVKPNSQFLSQSQSAYGRSAFDFIYGLNLTRLCTVLSGNGGVFSVGRVQSAILSLVVERCRLNRSHTSIPYYDIFAAVRFREGAIKFKVDLNEIAECEPEKFDDKKRLLDRSQAEFIKLSLEGRSVNITDLDRTNSEASPPLPFSLLDLQKACSNLFDYSPEQTLKLTQSLREDHKLITYNRTDTGYLPEEFHPQGAHIANFIKLNCSAFAAAVDAADFSIKSRAFSDAKVAESAHHGIIPCDVRADMSKVTKDEMNVYMLICRNFLAQFFPKKITAHIKVTASAGEYKLTAMGSQVERHGWAALYSGESFEDDEEQAELTQELTAFDELDGLGKYDSGHIYSGDTSLREGKSKPKALYVMSTLLEDLKKAATYVTNENLKRVLIERDKGTQEKGGIGTPATRGSIIELLFNRQFIEMKGKKIIATPFGEQAYDQLPSYLASVDLTAFWQLKMNQVRDRELSIGQFLTEVDGFVTQAVNHIKSQGISITSQPTSKTNKGKAGAKSGKPKMASTATEFQCKQCGEKLIKRESVKKKGEFWYGCSGYPKCKATYQDKNGEPV